MTIDDFDYELPEQLIAQSPLEDRSQSKLLVLSRESGEVRHLIFRDCLKFFNAGDVLVVNETRVTALRFFGMKSTGAEVEVFAIEPAEEGCFWCLVKPGRRLQVGAEVQLEGSLKGSVLAIDESGRRKIDFSMTPGWEEVMNRVGRTPLPPYITESLDDRERYQTVYNQKGGSSAAPTAGLHFTPEILEELERREVDIVKISLDVSLDTFRPVSVTNIADHQMHGEICRISEDAARRINSRSGRVIAVGTTSVRTLESFANVYGHVESGEMNSKLFISPGYRFRIVDGLFTNFHMPKTTMLMMISAFSSREAVFGAYKQAILSDYRFLSFGDSMLIL